MNVETIHNNCDTKCDTKSIDCQAYEPLVGSFLPVLMIPGTGLCMYMPVQYYTWLTINMISVEIFDVFFVAKVCTRKSS